MHKIIFLVIVCFVIYQQVLGQTGKVVLEIDNVQTNKGGELSAAIFNGNNFLKNGKELAKAVKDVSTSRMIMVFDDLPAGDYAFVAYQDIDRNKVMKTNFIGYPKEPWGISNNPRILFGPPSFAESKVRVSANQTTTVSIRLNR